MSDEKRACESCGRSGPSTEEHGYSQVSAVNDVSGALVCFGCWGNTNMTTDDIYDRIRVHRRAQKPTGPVSGESPLSKRGAPVRLGDMVQCTYECGRVVAIKPEYKTSATSWWIEIERNRTRGLGSGGFSAYSGDVWHAATPPESGGEPAPVPRRDCYHDAVGVELKVGDHVEHTGDPRETHRVVELYDTPREPGAQYGGPLMALRNSAGYINNDYGCAYWRKVDADGAEYAISSPKPRAPDPGPREQLAAFEAAVAEHLVPRLPRGVSVVTDMCRGGYPVLWVRDAHGRELMSKQYSRRPETFCRHDAIAAAAVVAGELMRLTTGERRS